MRKILPGVLIVAAVATLGDYVWFEHGVRHRIVTGILHGAVLLTAVGGVLGWLSGRAIAGLPIGAISGVGGALAYYALTPVLGGSAMLIAWAAVWIFLALLDGRVVRRVKRPYQQCLIHGVSAAVLSGVMFYLLVGSLWGHDTDGGRNYLIQFSMWALAWAPGIIAIGQELRRAPVS